MDNVILFLIIVFLVYMFAGTGLCIISYFGAKRLMKGKNDTSTSYRS